jgi:HSP20 family protein
MSTIVRWNPLREMATMQTVMDHLFEDTWRSVRPAVAGSGLALDVYESDAKYTIFTAIPGVEPGQISVSLDDDVLTISGEVAQPVFAENENARALLFERTYGKFARSVRLGVPVDSDNIEAAYENGVLKLSVPKAPQAQPKLIPIRVSNGSK